MDSESVSISGISGRFANSSSIEDFKRALLAGVDLVSDNHNRWPHESMNLPSRLGTINDLECFDSSFFGMNPKQADSNDPRIRKLLEVVFEAIVDAGVNPTELRGSNTGVFLAITQSFNNFSDSNAGSGILSRSTAIMANTISYSFDFKGPSYALDTGCSSSLYVLNQAFQALQNGSCDTAVVCAAQTHLDPSESVEFANLGVINPEGICKTFDQERNGYVKSDAIVAVLLQKSGNCNRIYGTLAGTGTNVDGFKSDGLIHPSNEMQREMLKRIYTTYNINPEDVFYVETHGTGTVVGDMEECQALSDFFCAKRKKPLLIGSVKSNAGHAETASGLVSLAKVVISANCGVIPGNLHYNKPASDIAGIVDGRLKVVDKNTPYEGGLIAINSFGFGGANGHAIVRPYMKKSQQKQQLTHRFVQVSGRTEQAIQLLIEKIQENQQNTHFLSLIDSIFSSTIENHNYRGYIVLPKSSSNKAEIEINKCSTQKKRPIWFSYSGMGSQWPGMAKDLMEIDVFRSTMKKCAEAVQPYGVNLEQVVVNGTKETFDNVINCFTAITAVSVCLTELLFSMGIQPDGIIGHSLGEVGCAYADGLITAEQATLIGFARGFATINTNLIPGLMAAVGLSAEECQKRLPADIFVACNNCSDNVTISGPKASIIAFTQQLTADGIFNKVVETANTAFHCKHVHDAGPKLLEFLQTVITQPKLRSKKWLPSAIPENEWNSELGKYNSAEYHYRNFMNSVQFKQVLQHVPKEAILVEIAPRGLLQAIFRRSLDSSVTKLALVNNQIQDNIKHFYSSVGKIYLNGGQPNLKKYFPATDLPVCIETPNISSLIKWDHTIKWTVPRYNPNRSFGDRVVIDLNEQDSKYLTGHVVDGRILFPGTGYFVLAWKTFAKMLGKPQEQLPVVLENVKILKAVMLSENEPSSLVVNIFKSTGQFEISNDTSTVATGKIYVPNNVNLEFLDYSLLEQTNYKLKLNCDDFYKELHLRGYDYYGIFRGVIEADIDGRNAVLKWHNNWITFMDTLMHHIVLKEQNELFVPTKVEKIVIDPFAHLKAAANTHNDINLDYNQYLKSAKCGGIEIRKIHGANIKRRNMQTDPTLQTYKFLPNSTESQGNDPFTFSLAIAIQIVIENNLDNSAIKIGDLTDNLAIAKSVIPKNSCKKVTLKKINEIEESFTLLITSDLSEENDKAIMSYMKNANFLFSKMDKFDDDYFSLFELECIYKHTTNAGTFVLLKKSSPLPDKYAIINATNSKFDWIENFKTAVEKYNTPDSRIYLISHDYNSGLIGFFNCVRLEQCCASLRVFFLRNGDTEPFSIRSKFYTKQLKKDLTVNVYQENTWGTYRLLPKLPLEKSPLTHACLISLMWDKTGLYWVQQTPYTSSYDRKIFVHFAPINSWDIWATNENIQDVQLGLEYSGTDEKGTKVMGIVPSGSLATCINAHPELTWSMPYNWSMEEAATVPLAYTLSYYGLKKAQVSSTCNVLVHNGMKDTSFAAIALALNEEANLYVTVKSQNEKDFLRRTFPKIQEKNILINKNQSFIESLAKNTSANIIFNCETEDCIRASLKCAEKNARFFEVGLKSLQDLLLVEDLVENQCFYSNISVGDVLRENEDYLKNLVKNIGNFIKNGTIIPLKYKIFDRNNVDTAIKNLENNDCEKCLIRMKEKSSFFSRVDNRFLALPRTYMDPEKCYILIGGLGGFGLELTKWLINRGATKIILNSRRDVYSGYQALCLKKWKDSGIVVLTDTSDTTTIGGAENLLNFGLNLGPIGGLFNVALVLKDELIMDQTVEKYNAVIGPKLFTTQNIDYLSRKLCKKLDYFVVFSSMVSSLGNATQSNYGFGNSAIERICEARKAEGLPALAVEWGPVADVGFVARLKTNVKFLEAIPQTINSCLNVLDQFMQQQQEIVLSSCVFTDEDEDCTNNKKSVLESVAAVFGIKNVSLMDDATTLLNLGMDSLLGFEIKHLLSREFNVELTVNDIRNLSIGSLKNMENTS